MPVNEMENLTIYCSTIYFLSVVFIFLLHEKHDIINRKRFPILGSSRKFEEVSDEQI